MGFDLVFISSQNTLRSSLPHCKTDWNWIGITANVLIIKVTKSLMNSTYLSHVLCYCCYCFEEVLFLIKVKEWWTTGLCRSWSTGACSIFLGCIWIHLKHFGLNNWCTIMEFKRYVSTPVLNDQLNDKYPVDYHWSIFFGVQISSFSIGSLHKNYICTFFRNVW